MNRIADNFYESSSTLSHHVHLNLYFFLCVSFAYNKKIFLMSVEVVLCFPSILFPVFFLDTTVGTQNLPLALCFGISPNRASRPFVVPGIKICSATCLQAFGGCKPSENRIITKIACIIKKSVPLYSVYVLSNYNSCTWLIKHSELS